MLNIGVLGCSEIAYRRFMPAALAAEGIRVLAVAEEYDRDRLEPFCGRYGLEREADFESILKRQDIQAVYIPQPPALHFQWAARALEAGKHVLVEKPSTTEYRLTKKLTDLAESRGLALHENYMFQYHLQMGEIRKLIREGRIGSLRLARADFGFPLRAGDDFRYSQALGGGALLDAGGYTLRLAALLLGDSVKVDAAQLCGLPGYEVDMYGSAVLSNGSGQTCQIGFGMDCCYTCRLEVWGSTGRIVADRIFTAPPDYEPAIRIESEGNTEVISLQKDSQFLHSIEAFYEETTDSSRRREMYREILLQAGLVDEVLSCSRKNSPGRSLHSAAKTVGT